MSYSLSNTYILRQLYPTVATHQTVHRLFRMCLAQTRIDAVKLLSASSSCCCHDREAFNLDAALVTVELSTDDVSGEEASDCW